MFLRILAALCALSSPAFAQQALFTDLNAGIALLSDAETPEFDFTLDGDRIIGQASAGFESSFTGGIETGFRGVFSKHISLSASYDYFEGNVQSVSADVTINGEPFSDTVVLKEFDTRGLDLDIEANTILGNVRYDFVGPREMFQPYVGVGGGVTLINGFKNTPTLGVTAGVRVPLSHGFYAGVRYRYLHLYEVATDFGFEFEDMDAHMISFTLGALVGTPPR